MHICIGNLTIIGSDTGLSPSWAQVIIWTNAAPSGTHLNEILLEIHTISYEEMHLKMLSGKKGAIFSRPRCVGYPTRYMRLHHMV